MSGNRTSFARLCGLAVAFALAAGGARAGVVSVWDGAGSNDTTSWSGLGGDGTALGASFSASSAHGNAITGSFKTGGSGLTAIQCPAIPSCSWTGGFTAGDTTVWAFDSTSGVGTGPVTVGFGTAVLAGGLELQADALPGAFTAQAEAFAGGTSLGTFTVTSDAVGDPVFIGVQDTVAEITSIAFDMTSCPGTCDVHDFAVDTLLSKNPSVTPPMPEPASLVALASALIGFGSVKLRRRRRRRD